MKKAVLIALFIFFPAMNLFSQGGGPQPGQKAPALNIYKWINGAPADSTIAGKVIILEFWATWCGPCKKIIPHMNELVDKFASDSVLFVSVSKEKPEKVIKFMENKEMKSLVAIDYNGITSKNYGIRSIPHAFVIAPNGIVAWRGHPAGLTEENIGDYLSKVFSVGKQE